MDFVQFFRDGFVADDLANALLELGMDESGTKVELAQRLAGTGLPLPRLFGAFYDQALSNACGTFGLPVGHRQDNLLRLVAYAQQAKSGSGAGR